MIEDKKLICNLFGQILKQTHHCSDLSELKYWPDSEEVIAIYKNGHRKNINVACDSGWGMLKDIIHGLE